MQCLPNHFLRCAHCQYDLLSNLTLTLFTASTRRPICFPGGSIRRGQVRSFGKTSFRRIDKTTTTRAARSRNDTRRDDSERTERDGGVESVFVKNIPFDASATDLVNAFSKFDGFVSARILRHEDSDTPRGCGFVDFADANSADIALLSNGHIVIGDRLAVIERVRTPRTHQRSLESLRKYEPSSTIFVWRIVPQMTKEELRDHFAQFGDVKEVRLDEIFGYHAHVEFADIEDAKRVIGNEDAKHAGGRRLHLDFSKPPRSKYIKDDVKSKASDPGKAAAPTTGAQWTNSVFVKNLPHKATLEQLEEKFRDLKGFVSARLLKTPGAAFVDFADKRSRNAALTKSMKIWVRGKQVRIEEAKSIRSTHLREDPPLRRAATNEQHEPTATLFVYNTGNDMTVDELWQHFSQFGEVKAVRVPRNKEDRATSVKNVNKTTTENYAHVEFENIEEAKKVIATREKAEVINGRILLLQYARAKSIPSSQDRNVNTNVQS